MYYLKLKGYNSYIIDSTCTQIKEHCKIFDTKKQALYFLKELARRDNAFNVSSWEIKKG